MTTSYFWESQLGFLGFVVFLALIGFFLVLLVALFVQIMLSIKEKIQGKQRLILICYMTAVLVLTFFFPAGVIDFERFESNCVFIAGKESEANCTTTLKLRENNTFTEKIICFGISEKSGTYLLKNDTLFFKYNESDRNTENHYPFGVIRHQGNEHFLVRYSNHSDTSGTLLRIVKNQLIQQ